MKRKATTVTDFDSMETEYLASALEWGHYQSQRNFRAGNSAATKLEKLGKQLRENTMGQESILRLMTHESDFVKVWAAKDGLMCVPDQALEVLKCIGSQPGLLGTSARTVISEWESGALFKPTPKSV